MLQKYASFWIFRKESENSFSNTYCVLDFSRKMFSCYILLIDQTSLSGYLYLLRYGQYVYCNGLFPRLWRHKFWHFTLSFQPNHFFTWPKSQDKNLNILRTKRDFKVKQKAFFITFKTLSVAKNCPRLGSAPYSLTM